VDCLGHRAPASWFGDGACDNGIYQHNGHWINFNCEASGFDGGDCPGGLTHMECVSLIQDLDHCEAPAGGNDCAAGAKLSSKISNTFALDRDYLILCRPCCRCVRPSD
jgi:hypothetical protein